MILAILGIVFVNFACGEISSENSVIQVIGNNAEETGNNGWKCDGYCHVMWQDAEGINSGDHYWKVHFESEGTLMAVNLTTKEDFEENKNAFLPANLRQRIVAGDTVGILVSFSDGKWKVYVGRNDESLAEIFEKDATIDNIFPSIQFSGFGQLNITKESDLPSEADRHDLQDVVGIEGSWAVLPENINFGADLVQKYPNFHHNDKHVATLLIQKESANTIGLYKVNVQVINSMWIQMRAYNDFWRSSGAVTTLVGGPIEYMDFETKLSELVQNPDSVAFLGDKLTLKKGDKVVTLTH